MADNVEGLYIEVESSSAAAAKQLDALTDSLERLKSKLSNNRSFKTFSKNYTEMVNTFNSVSLDTAKLESFRYLSQITGYINSKSVSPLKSFAKNYVEAVNAINNSAMFDRDKLESLRYFAYVIGGLKGATISPTIARQIDNIGFSIQNINTGGLSNISEFVEALMQLERLKDVKLTKTFVKNFADLAEVSQKLTGYDFTKLKEYTSALALLGSLANVDTSSVKGLSTAIKSMGNETQKASKRSRNFNTVLANIRTSVMKFAMIIRTAERITEDSLGVYGDYVETLNLFKMALGDAAKQEYEFATQAQDLLGIDLTQWMKAQGVFNALASGFGVASDQAALMSRNLTQLAYDISSFYNIDVADAISKVQSGFAGQIRPVRNLGYDLSQAKLEAIALSYGIDKSVKSMTQAEKSELRYIALMTQLTQVQGDLSRTLDSPVNQMRLLNAQLDQMKRSIGLVLLPLLNKILPYVNAIFRVIKMIANEIAALFGYTLPTISDGDWSASVTMGAEELEDDLDDATGAAEKLKNTLASFDQINLITSSSGGGGKGLSDTISGGGLGLDLPSYDFLGDATENQAQKIADAIKNKINPALEGMYKIIQLIRENADEVKIVLMAIGGAVIAGSLIRKFENLKSVFGGIEALSGSIKKALGVGFVIGGVTLSYTGGKSLASGDITKGIIESVLGVGLAAIGGFLTFGATGAFIAVGLSIGFLWEGYQDQKAKETEEWIEGVFYSIKEGRMSLDEFNTSWDEFIKGLGVSDFDTTGIDSTKTTIQETGRAIINLQNDYELGRENAADFVGAVDLLFIDMRDAIEKHLEESGLLIKDAFQHELSVVTKILGLTEEQSDAAWNDVTVNMLANIDKQIEGIKELGKGFTNGTVDYDTYIGAVNELMKNLEAMGFDFGESSQMISEFQDKWKDGVNFTSLEEGLTLLDNLSASHDETLKQILERKQKLIDAIELGLNTEGISEETRTTLEKTREAVELAYGGLESTLDEGYRKAVESFEKSAFGNWEEVWKTGDLDAAITYVGDDITVINDKLKELYDQEGWDKSKLPFQGIIDASEEFVENFGKGFGAEEGSTLFEKVESDVQVFYLKLDEIRSNFLGDGKKFNQQSAELLEKYNQKSKESMRLNTEDVKDWIEKSKRITGGGGKYIDGILGKMPQELTQMLMQSTLTMMQHKGDFGKAGKGLVDEIGAAFSDTKSFANKINALVSEGSGAITSEENLKKFLVASDTLMGKMRESFTDPNGKVKQTLQTTVNKVKDLDSTEFSKKGQKFVDKFLEKFGKKETETKVEKSLNEFKKIIHDKFGAEENGEKEGKLFTDGIKDKIKEYKDGTGSIGEATDDLAKRMQASFVPLATSLPQFFTSLMQNIAAIWNSLEITPAEAKFNPSGVPKIIPMQAKGGFVPSGDLFYANENGVAEYIGSLGGKTAVANNNQIIKGVSDGVYRALKDTGIANDVKKIARKSNNVVFAPSVEAGRFVKQSSDMYNQVGGRYQ